MDTNTIAPTASVAREGHLRSYPRFLVYVARIATDGNFAFYAWMTLLTAIFLVGVNAWAQQVNTGMQITNLSDHVSWGLYIANFTFMVGVAAGAVMMVIPAYLYHDEDMHDVVILGEMLAIAAIAMCLGYVTVDLGRPDRAWHLIPGIGRFNFPVSMLTWDVIVLSGYLLLNLHVCGYLLYQRFRGERPKKSFYVPVVLLSIVWAVSIHTVTAFLYCGLGGRPFWNSALLAPRFLASAFVSGPAFIILTILLLRRIVGVRLPRGPVETLVKIVRVTTLINLLMVGSEVFTAFYTGGTHEGAARYLFFGDHGNSALVPWIWSAIGLNVVAAALFLSPRTARHGGRLAVACCFAFVGCWIEKGMGLIIPGFVPSTLHELVEYLPSLVEWKVSAGIAALGLLIFTVAIKAALPILEREKSGTERATSG
jgi:Ni/Fe-hydrogenase subunit HybB-like protein